MEEFLRYALLQLVEYPDEVVIAKTETDNKVDFRLVVAKSDIPRVIGRSGHTIQALRALLLASGKKKGIRATLEIVE